MSRSIWTLGNDYRVTRAWSFVDMSLFVTSSLQGLQAIKCFLFQKKWAITNIITLLFYLTINLISG